MNASGERICSNAGSVAEGGGAMELITPGTDIVQLLANIVSAQSHKSFYWDKQINHLIIDVETASILMTLHKAISNDMKITVTQMMKSSKDGFIHSVNFARSKAI